MQRKALLRLLQKLLSMENLCWICCDRLGLKLSFRMVGTKKCWNIAEKSLLWEWNPAHTYEHTHSYTGVYTYLNALTGRASVSIITVTISRYYGWILSRIANARIQFIPTDKHTNRQTHKHTHTHTDKTHKGQYIWKPNHLHCNNSQRYCFIMLLLYSCSCTLCGLWIKIHCGWVKVQIM